MRQETQHWYELTAFLEQVFGGVPASGLSPECFIMRIFDGLWYNPGTALFDSPTPVSNLMTPYAGAVAPGAYKFSPAPGSLARPEDEAQKGYLVRMEEGSTNTFEYAFVHVTNQQAWAADRVDYTAVGTFGEGVNMYDALAGSIKATSFAAGAINAAAIATNAIDADALATDAAVEIAGAVWTHDISAIVDPNQAGHNLRSLMLGELIVNGSLLAVPDCRHSAVSPSTAPAGKFYSSTNPAPSTKATEAYVDQQAMLYISADFQSYPVKITGVASDGTGNHFTLEHTDAATWDIDIAVNDLLIVTTHPFSAGTPSLGAVWDEPTASHIAAGSFGEEFRRLLALRQQNMRVVYTAWSASNVPTAGTIYIYASQADMQADSGGTGVGSIGSYDFTATFNGSLQPTEYTSGKIT